MVLILENGPEPGEVEEMLPAAGYPAVLLPVTPLAGVRAVAVPVAIFGVGAAAVAEVPRGRTRSQDFAVIQPEPLSVENSGRGRACNGPALVSPRRPGTGGMAGVGRAARSTAPWVGLTLLLGWAILGFYAS